MFLYVLNLLFFRINLFSTIAIHRVGNLEAKYANCAIRAKNADRLMVLNVLTALTVLSRLIVPTELTL